MFYRMFHVLLNRTKYPSDTYYDILQYISVYYYCYYVDGVTREMRVVRGNNNLTGSATGPRRWWDMTVRFLDELHRVRYQIGFIIMILYYPSSVGFFAAPPKTLKYLKYNISRGRPRTF